MNWLYYLLEANAYLLVFYVVYYLLLRHETYYQLNRFYLLVCSALAFIIPLIRLGRLLPALVPQQVHIIPQMGFASFAGRPGATLTVQGTTVNYWVLTYVAIALLLFTSFCLKLFKLIRLSRSGNNTVGDEFRLIEIDEDVPAFSFFRLLFINKKLAGSPTIIAHELVHIRQGHSWDIIYLELLKIVNWFNPAVYLLQNSIKELHEYIADARINDTEDDINRYTDFLLSNAYGANHTSLTNNFFHKNLLKNRIIMLHQKRSGYLARLKYLALVPVCGALLCSSTLAYPKNYAVVDLLPQSAALKKTAPSQLVGQAGLKAITDTTMNAFYKQIGRNTRYPAAAFENKLSGRVIAVFSVDENNNIVNVGILRSPDRIMSEEVVRVLKNCSGKFKGQINVTYMIPVFFAIQDAQTGKYVGTAAAASNHDAVIPRDQSVNGEKKITLNEVVVMAYAKQ